MKTKFNYYLMVAAACFWTFSALAQNNDRESSPLPAISSLGASPPPISDLGNGLYQIGGVRLDTNAKTVVFRASVNMSKGPVEYLLVGVGGKTHESVFVTSIEPWHLHVAMLLLGANGDQTKDEVKEPPPTAIDATYLDKAPVLKGDSIIITVSWKTNDATHKADAADFVRDQNKNRPDSSQTWIYTGSMFFKGTFLAQQERSMAALVTDPSALINNSKGHDADWVVNSEKTPPQGAPVEVSIKLADAKSDQPPSTKQDKTH